MAEVDQAPVVVGTDGSTEAVRAARQAAREAESRRLPLRVVHAFIWPLFNVPLDPSEGGLASEANRTVEQAVDEARAQAPRIEVTGVVVDGAAPPVLIQQSDAARMIVLGSRGLGGFGGLLLGSVAMQVTPRAACPVLVVRGEPVLRGPIVVGVDGSPHGEAALAFALEEAHYRQAAVRAVRASAGSDGLGESLAHWSDRYPDVPLERLELPGQPAPILLDAARDAQLLVVGARGLGGFKGLLLGSVSHALLQHAPCPVAVVPRSPKER